MQYTKKKNIGPENSDMANLKVYLCWSGLQIIKIHNLPRNQNMEKEPITKKRCRFHPNP